MVFDNQKLKNAIPGLHMEVRMEEGIRRTVNHVLSHPECQREDLKFDQWCDQVIQALEKAKKEVYSQMEEKERG